LDTNQTLTVNLGDFTFTGALNISNGTFTTAVSTQVSPRTTNCHFAGTINATGGTLNLGGWDNTWDNSGTITASNPTLNIGGSWTNTGVINVGNTTVNFGSSLLKTQ